MKVASILVGMLLPRTLLALISFSAFSTYCFAQSCADIGKVDFRNVRIMIAGKSADHNELTTYNNEPTGKYHFNMRHGVAHHWDGGDIEDPGFLDYADKDRPPDWEAKIVLDKVVTPPRASAVRFIQLEDEHLTGTGEWFYVLGFTCYARKLKRVFQFTSRGVTLRAVNDDSFILEHGVWQKGDPEMGPSSMRRLRYQWLPEKGRYVRVGETCYYFNGKKYVSQTRHKCK